MLSAVRKTHPVMKLVNSALVDLPAPSNLSVWWNFGSLLGLLLGVQIITGLLLAAHYTASVEHAFNSVIHILRDVNSGWILNGIHANGASMVFLCLYIHVGRGLYYGSYTNIESWTSGVVLLLMMMGTAFLGYVLPWGQMSFWGATVITNLLSSIPYIGSMLVQWIWGGFAVDNAALTRFYALHFLLPFLITGVSVLHILFLHETGSNNPLGLNSDGEKVPFHAYYTFKDLVGFVVLLFGLAMLVLFFPQLLKDPENYIPANPLVTPVHIQPEWYFLFAYAILRSIPDKLGGVLGLVSAVLVLLIVPLVGTRKYRSLSYYPLGQIMFWGFVGVFFILTWIGSCPVETPYVELGQVFTVLYFSYFLLNPLTMMVWEKILDSLDYK